MSRLVFLFACLLCPALLWAQLHVVASFSILKDMIEQVGGADVVVESIVGPNADAHVFEPTPKTAQMIAQADLIVVNGLGFEGWLDRLIAANKKTVPICVASRGLAPLKMDGTWDPHIWHDVQQMPLYVETLMQSLQAADPAHAQDYARRGKAYQQKLQDLHLWVQAQFKNIPSAQRKIITAHDGFQYFGQRYQIKFMAPQGLSTSSEPSMKEMAALAQQIKVEGIQVLFLENMAPGHLIQQLSRDLGVKVGEVIFSDALSEKNQVADTYEKMIRYNVRAFLSTF